MLAGTTWIENVIWTYITLHKKLSFPLRVFSENVTKSAADLDTFPEEIPDGRLHFLCSVRHSEYVLDVFWTTHVSSIYVLCPGRTYGKADHIPSNFLMAVVLYKFSLVHSWKLCLILTHFSPVSHFYTPWKHQKTFGFLTFSGSIEMWHWIKMG